MDLLITMTQPGKGGNNGRKFGNQANSRPIPGGMIQDIGDRIKHAQCGNRGLKSIHRMPMLRETFQEVGNPIFNSPVMKDVLIELN